MLTNQNCDVARELRGGREREVEIIFMDKKYVYMGTKLIQHCFLVIEQNFLIKNQQARQGHNR